MYTLKGFHPIDDCPQLLMREHLLDTEQAQYYYQRLLTENEWPDNSYEVFGRRFTLPRQQTWHADSGIVYSYSNNLLQSRPWTKPLLDLREKVEAATGADFNAVLVNYYRNGDDYVDWHSDDELEMGEEPLIASLSLGAERSFAYREIEKNAGRRPLQGQVQLPAGSLVLMLPAFQHRWQHSIPRCGEIAGRINLTFRYVHKQTRT